MWFWNNHFSKFEPKEEYVIKIISIKDDIEYSTKYVGKILTGPNKGLRIFVYVYENIEYSYGDILKVTGETKLPASSRNDGDFNYSRYLKTKKIVAILVTEKIEFIKREESIISKIYDVKNKCVKILDENFDKEQSKVLQAMLLGEKNNISEETEEIFSRSGLNHILAISGLHVSYVVLYMENILKKVMKNIKLRQSILIFLIILYMIFTGGSPSSVRACIMTIMYYLSKILLRERDFYISFLISLIFILILNPFNIYSMSMWFSFLGTLGIYLFGNAIHKIIRRKFKIKSNKAINYFLEVLLVGVSAQILIFPILWKVFGTISLSFWISNLLVSELIGPMLVLGYMSLIIFPFRKYIVFIENILVKLFLYMALFASKIPFNRFFIAKPSVFALITYYTFILAFVLFYKKHKIFVLKCIFNFKYIKKQVCKYKILLKRLFAIILVFFSVSRVIYYIPKDLRINFLSVDQGDCTLIRTKYNKVILIDSGEGHSEKYDYGKKAVLPYLLAHNISKIDYLIISHFDFDHCRSERFMY